MLLENALPSYSLRRSPSATPYSTNPAPSVADRLTIVLPVEELQGDDGM
jgi:hypothetical protein